MTYLIAKFAIVFLLTTALGFLLGRWWVRRSFVDVTESYQTMSKAASDAPWQTLWSRLDNLPQPEIPEVDLGPVRQGLADLDARIKAMPAPRQPDPVDLTPVNERIERVEALIAALPKPAQPERVDLAPVNERLQRLEASIAGMPRPEKPERVDLAPVNQRIERVEALISRLPESVKPEPVNLRPINQHLQRLEASIAGLPKPEKSERVDLAPLNQRIDRVEAALRAIEIPAAPELGPVTDHLRIIEGRLTQLTTRQGKTVAAGPVLLKKPDFGAKDDLKLISGVGPKLERLLNRNGVFYFWQVSDWKAADIKTMDARLDTFKGRITRDNWVRQAKALAKRSTATRPSGTAAAASPAG